MHRAPEAALASRKRDANRIWVNIAAVTERPLKGGPLHAARFGPELGGVAITMITGGRIGARNELQ